MPLEESEAPRHVPLNAAAPPAQSGASDAVVDCVGIAVRDCDGDTVCDVKPGAEVVRVPDADCRCEGDADLVEVVLPVTLGLLDAAAVGEMLRLRERVVLQVRDGEAVAAVSEADADALGDAVTDGEPELDALDVVEAAGDGSALAEAVCVND